MRLDCIIYSGYSRCLNVWAFYWLGPKKSGCSGECVNLNDPNFCLFVLLLF